jgi:hypothetical protein
MNLVFSAYPGNSPRTPMALLDPEPNAMLSTTTETVRIETSNRSVREQWQQL